MGRQQQPECTEFDRAWQMYVTNINWAGTWSRNIIPPQQLSLINLAMLAASGQMHEFEHHFRNALLRTNVPLEQLRSYCCTSHDIAELPPAPTYSELPGACWPKKRSTSAASSHWIRITSTACPEIRLTNSATCKAMSAWLRSPHSKAGTIPDTLNGDQLHEHCRSQQNDPCGENPFIRLSLNDGIRTQQMQAIGGLSFPQLGPAMSSI